MNADTTHGKNRILKTTTSGLNGKILRSRYGSENTGTRDDVTTRELPEY